MWAKMAGSVHARSAMMAQLKDSVAHDITGSPAWVAVLVLMALADVLTRLVVIYLRGRRLAVGA